MRLAEVVASLSLATDLATGQPLEHGLRRALLALWLGADLGLDPAELSDVYYAALLGTVGCPIEGRRSPSRTRSPSANRSSPSIPLSTSQRSLSMKREKVTRH